jgi:hypothetical protein
VRSSALSDATWRKSSRSNGGGNGACMEFAELPGRIVLRDSKHPTGPVLAFPPAQWSAFLLGVQTGRFS